ncbi:MAG: ribose transport system substrate-binding protein [Actinomycetota bacterium]|jgi:ABC-type sugar transport system substrate-binding protein
MYGRRTGRGRSRLLPLAGVAGLAVVAVATTAIPAGSAVHRSAAPKLTLAKARADVAVARRPMKRFTGPKVSPGPVPKGKSVVSIYSVPAPLPQRSAGGVVDAAKAIGWSGNVVFGNGTPSGWLDAINTAVTGGASAVVMSAGVPALMAPGIAKAKSAGAPFVDIFNITKDPPPGLVAQIGPRERTEGYRLAEWIVAKTKGKGAQIIAYNSPQFPDLQVAAAGFRQGIKDAGAKYKLVANTLSPATDIGSAAGAQRMAALFRKYPHAKYIFTLSESWAGTFAQAVQSSGRTDITGLGTDGDFFLPQIRKGARFVEIGPDTKEYGWFATDAILRAMNHKPQVKYNVPFRLLDGTNAKSTTGPGISNSYDFKHAWLKLWGVK